MMITILFFFYFLLLLKLWVRAKCLYCWKALVFWWLVSVWFYCLLLVTESPNRLTTIVVFIVIFSFNVDKIFWNGNFFILWQIEQTRFFMILFARFFFVISVNCFISQERPLHVLTFDNRHYKLDLERLLRICYFIFF